MATLKSLVDETTNIKNELKTCHSNLKNNLSVKGIEVSNEDKFSILINKVSSIQTRKYGCGFFKPIYSIPRQLYGTGQIHVATYVVDAKDEFIDCARITYTAERSNTTITGSNYNFKTRILLNGNILDELGTTIDYLKMSKCLPIALKKGDIIDVQTFSSAGKGYMQFDLDFGYISEDVAD